MAWNSLLGSAKLSISRPKIVVAIISMAYLGEEYKVQY